MFRLQKDVCLEKVCFVSHHLCVYFFNTLRERLWANALQHGSPSLVILRSTRVGF